MTKGVKSVKLTREKALAKIPMSVHKQYNLLNAVYTGSTQPMTGVICPIHGEVSVPYRKLREGCGCKRCGQIAAGKKRRKLCNGGLMPNVNFNKMTLLEVLEGFPKEIRRRYDFSQAVYRNASVPITDIICREHGKFKRHSSLLRKGKGCQH